LEKEDLSPPGFFRKQPTWHSIDFAQRGPRVYKCRTGLTELKGNALSP